MALCWRLILALLFIASFTHGGNHMDIPDGTYTQYYCCLTDEQKPKLFRLPSGNGFQIWMYIELDKSRNIITYQRFFFLIKTENYGGEFLRRSLFRKLTGMLLSVQSATHAISKELYRLNQNGQIVSFIIHTWTEQKTASISTLLEPPKGCKPLATTERMKYSGTKYIDCSRYKIVPAMPLVLSSLNRHSREACYDPLYNYARYEFIVSENNSAFLNSSKDKDRQSLSIPGKFNIKTTRHNPQPGLPEVIQLHYPFINIDGWVHDTIDLTLTAQTPPELRPSSQEKHLVNTAAAAAATTAFVHKTISTDSTIPTFSLKIAIEQLAQDQCWTQQNYQVCLQKLKEFINKHQPLFTHANASCRGQIEALKNQCYLALSEQMAIAACESFRLSLDPFKPGNMLQSLRKIADICQQHGVSLPKKEKDKLRKTLIDGSENLICSLHQKTTANPLDSFRYNLSKAILRCWILIPEISLSVNTQFCRSKILSQITTCLLDRIYQLQRFQQGKIIFPIPDKNNFLKNETNPMQKWFPQIKVVWTSMGQGDVHERIMQNLTRLSASISSTGNTSNQLLPETPAFHPTIPCEAVSLYSKQSELLSTLAQSESLLDDDRTVIIEELRQIKEWHPTCHSYLLTGYKQYAQRLLTTINDSLEKQNLFYLRKCHLKLKELSRLPFNNPQANLLINRVNAYIMLRRCEQGVQTGQAASFEFFLKTVKLREETQTSLLSRSDNDQLNAAMTAIFEQNIKRIERTLEEDTALACQQITQLKKIFASAPYINSALIETLNQLDTAVTACKCTATNKQSFDLLTSQPDTKNNFIADQIADFSRAFGFLKTEKQQHLCDQLYDTVTRFSKTPRTVALHGHFIKLLCHPAIAQSAAGKIIQQWQTDIYHHIGTWKTTFENPISECIIRTLFNPPSANSPRVVLYGSQLHCALISCIYDTDSRSVGITPSDWDILCDPKNLREIFQSIARSISPEYKMDEAIVSRLINTYHTAGRLPEAQTSQKIIYPDEFTIIIDVRGYDFGDIKRSFRVNIFEKSRCLCQIDLIPAFVMPSIETCCQFRVQGWDTPHHRIEGIGLEDLFYRLSLGLGEPSYLLDNSQLRKQQERSKKSAIQITCWLEKEQKTGSRLPLYSTGASAWLNTLGSRKKWVEATIPQNAKMATPHSGTVNPYLPEPDQYRSRCRTGQH